MKHIARLLSFVARFRRLPVWLLRWVVGRGPDVERPRKR